ncbi:MAG: HAD hydrolase-like protein [Spirochaetes bacterium]|nr:HAD hydrolase-like protein [Spirochaetota bacterium]
MNLIAFDMDGTIFDNSDILVESYRKTVDDFNSETGLAVAVPSDEKIFSVIGLPPLGIFQELMPGVDTKFCDLMIRLFNRSLISGISDGGGSIYPGVEELLDKLVTDNYRLVMASNGALNYIEKILEFYNLKKYFLSPVIVVDEQKIHNKNELVTTYLDNSEYEMAIMVGDRVSDRDAARANGIPFIGCSYGHAGISEVEAEKYVAHSVSEIYQLVLSITSR